MKRKIIAILFTLIFFTSSTLSTFAQSVPVVPSDRWYSPSLTTFYNKVVMSPDQEIFGERYTYAQVQWIIHSISLLFQIDLSSKENLDKLKNLFNSLTYLDPPPKLADYTVLGPTGLILGGIAEVYQNPAGSGIQYLARGLEKFNLSSPVHAQGGGYGYSNNQVVLPLWTASRNLCYFLMVILLIAAGFMIMFRVKVNAQTAVSIQVMIPKIIITLVLITFSYAIAGLLIDLVYLVLTLLLSALSLTGVVDGPAGLGQAVKFYTGNYWNIAFYYLIPWALMIVLGIGAAALSGGALGALALVPLIISLVLCWLLLKVWWMLLKTYLSIMVGFILAPWQILLGLIPGSKSGFGSWLRGMIANCSVFVFTPLMFLLAAYLNPFDTGLIPAGLSFISDFLDPTGLTSMPISTKAVAMPLFGFGSSIGWSMGFFASLAILSLIPKTAEAVKAALKVEAFKYGSAFGESIGMVSSVSGNQKFIDQSKEITDFYGGNADKTESTLGSISRGAKWASEQTKKSS